MLKRKAAEDAKENNDTPKKQKSMTDFFATKEVKTSVTAVANDAKAAQSEGASGEKRLSALFTDAAWKRKMAAEMNKPYFAKIEKFLEEEYKKGKKIFPPYPEIFNAFNMAPLQQLKVVIIGQDPYHDNNQAHGLCFSVRRGINPPPSLKNMYKELSTDIEGFQIPTHGCLEAWAKQGMLLLNASLTVEAHKANSHSHIGWQTFTDAVIKAVSDQCVGVVFILWGGFAQKKESLIDKKKHRIIKAAHPSPLSATKFFGCKCFSQTNEALKAFGKKPIDWTL
uniref:Uracil-DNA glycosylase n=1 Tax=Plectus sambesii TaxID=2011161 RepID=A0A914UTF5_9BILA